MKAAEKISRNTHCLSRNGKKRTNVHVRNMAVIFIGLTAHSANTAEKIACSKNGAVDMFLILFFSLHASLSFFSKLRGNVFLCCCRWYEYYGVFYRPFVFFLATAVPVCLQLIWGGRFCFNLFMHLGVLRACCLHTLIIFDIYVSIWCTEFTLDAPRSLWIRRALSGVNLFNFSENGCRNECQSILMEFHRNGIFFEKPLCRRFRQIKMKSFMWLLSLLKHNPEMHFQVLISSYHRSHDSVLLFHYEINVIHFTRFHFIYIH